MNPRTLQRVRRTFVDEHCQSILDRHCQSINLPGSLSIGDKKHSGGRGSEALLLTRSCREQRMPR